MKLLLSNWIGCLLFGGLTVAMVLTVHDSGPLEWWESPLGYGALAVFGIWLIARLARDYQAKE